MPALNNDLPAECRAFILEHIGSVVQLEALLLLRRSATAWTVEALARELRVVLEEIAQLRRSRRLPELLRTAADPGALADGLDDLDEQAGGDFAGLSDADATKIVEQVADGAFFKLVHSTTVVALYDDHQVWELLGYEGPSFDKGGYVGRGFDDLDWLPDPRVEEYDGEPRVELVKAVGSN